MTPSSVVARYMLDSPLRNSKDRPLAKRKFMFSVVSFLVDCGMRLRSMRSEYSSPFFMDHSVILPSAEILTRLSPLLPLPRLIHWMSHTVLVCLSRLSLF